MKPRLLGFGDDRLDTVGQRRRGDIVVARDIVQADVAETALLPVTTMGNCKFVPTTVGPKPVHRVEHVEERQIAVQRQSVPGRRADFGEGNIWLMAVDVADYGLIGITHEGTNEAALGSLAAQVLEQCEERQLAVI